MSQETFSKSFPISGSSFYQFQVQRLKEIKAIQQTHSQKIGSGIDFDMAITIWLTADLINCRKSGIF